MITKIELKNFRNHEEISIENDKKILFLHGENTSGKTSIIESIFLVTNRRSFRSKHISNVIKNDRDTAYIKILFKEDEIIQKIEFEIKKEESNLTLNGRKITTTNIKNIFDAFLIDSRLLTEYKYNKSTRQKFIDNSISKYFKIYNELIKEFTKLYKMFSEIRESNEQLLKESVANRMNDVEIEIINFRERFISKINEQFAEITKKWFNESIKIEYKKSKEHEKNIRLILNDFTTIKKDDFNFIDERGNNIYDGRSQGEVRMIFLMFVIAVVLITNQNFESKQILLLDDLFSDLDKDNQNKIIELLEYYSIEAVITTPISIGEYKNTNKIEIRKDKNGGK